jgi:hypothetical protein
VRYSSSPVTTAEEELGIFSPKRGTSQKLPVPAQELLAPGLQGGFFLAHRMGSEDAPDFCITGLFAGDPLVGQFWD